MTINSNSIRDGFIAAVEGIRPTVFMTVVFNQMASIRSAEAVVTELLRRIERAGHGKRWSNYPADQRLRAYGFPEHPKSNLHYHLALAGSDRICMAALNDGEELWRSLTKSGHAHVESIRASAAVARYITKYASSEWALDHFVAYGPRLRICK